MNTEPLSFWYFHGVYDVSLYNTNISIFSSGTTFQLQLRCMPENFFYSLRRISLKIWQLWFYLLVLLSFNHVGRSKTRTRSEWFPQNVTWDRFPQWSPPHYNPLLGARVTARKDSWQNHFMNALRFLPSTWCLCFSFQTNRCWWVGISNIFPRIS